MEVTNVSAVARYVDGAFWETNVENCGESPTTLIPQTNMKIRKHRTEKEGRKMHKTQQMHEISSANHAIR